MPRTRFVHDVDGYAFLNVWEMSAGDWAQLRDVLNGAVASIASVPAFATLGTAVSSALARKLGDAVLARFDPGPVGLCGGMTLAAADAYRRSVLPPRGAFAGGAKVPGWASPPESALRALLWRRLLDSLRDGVAANTLLSMAVGLGLSPLAHLGGRAWVRARAREALTTIRQRIDAGEVCPIAIVGTTPNPMANHQVLVTGYEDPGPWGRESCRLYVYEPNGPNVEQTIDYDFSGQQEARESTHERGHHGARGPLLGFFLAPFAYQEPLPALTLLEPLRREGARLRVSVRNTGFGDTPPLRLWLRGRASGQARDPGGEASPLPLRTGMGRGLDLALPSPPPEVVELAVAVEPAPGRRAWRLIPEATL